MAFDRKAYHKNYYLKRRTDAINKLGGCCAVCGSKENLEFDHIIKTTKIASLGKLFTKSQKRINEELEKCQILCKKCHQKKTKESKDLVRCEHGSPSKYKNHNCRCLICVNFMKEYRKRFRKIAPNGR